MFDMVLDTPLTSKSNFELLTMVIIISVMTMSCSFCSIGWQVPDVLFTGIKPKNHTLAPQ